MEFYLYVVKDLQLVSSSLYVVVFYLAIHSKNVKSLKDNSLSTV